MDTELLFDGKTYRVVLGKTEGQITAQVDDRSLEGEVIRLTPNCISITLQNRRHTAYVARSNEKLFVQVGNRLFELEEAGAAEESVVSIGPAAGGDSVSSPMPGRIVKIPVSEGQEVEKNEILVIVEAMKMENPLRSPVAGRVKKIHYSEGDLVAAGTPIVVLESGKE